MIHLKSNHELELMRVAGRLTAQILAEICELAKPGVTTWDLDEVAEARCRELKVKPAFKGYQGFPGCLCVSVNEEIVHGIPSKKRILRSGDLLGIDFGIQKDGYFGDTARTVIIGGEPPTSEAAKLVDGTREALQRGIDACRVGNRVFDIGYAVQNYVEGLGFSVVREFVGHGIGRELHEDPQVPNFGMKGRGAPLREGMVLAIEPMVNIGTHEVRVLADGWTAVTADRSLSAHFEHTVAITARGPEILTLPS
jgi:methionyl aminopeptidase